MFTDLQFYFRFFERYRHMKNQYLATSWSDLLCMENSFDCSVQYVLFFEVIKQSDVLNSFCLLLIFWKNDEIKITDILNKYINSKSLAVFIQNSFIVWFVFTSYYQNSLIFSCIIFRVADEKLHFGLNMTRFLCGEDDFRLLRDNIRGVILTAEIAEFYIYPTYYCSMNIAQSSTSLKNIKTLISVRLLL